MYITFRNPGLIDIQGAFITGLSAKEQGSEAIGQFGTGLKYAIASILRWEGSITIYRGLDAYQFNTAPLSFRGTEHLQIICTLPDGTDQHLGFTTHYGANWKPWQVYRELFANALDEGGEVVSGRHSLSPTTTSIVVSCAELAEPHARRDKIILPPSTFFSAESNNVQIREEASFHLYYKNVRVATKISALTFNISSAHRVNLTEEREVSMSGLWTAEIECGRAIQTCTKEQIILRALNSEAEFDQNLSFSASTSASPAFLSVAERLYRRAPTSHERLRKVLEAQRPEAVALPSLPLKPMQQRALAKALGFLRQMDIDVDAATAPTISMADLGEATLAKYVIASHTITVSPYLFDQGLKQLVSTLYEEFLHATTHKQDCTYDLQTYLFNKIVNLYEEHVFGEPL